jgi:hypothetical protein
MFLPDESSVLNYLGDGDPLLHYSVLDCFVSGVQQRTHI